MSPSTWAAVAAAAAVAATAIAGLALRYAAHAAKATEDQARATEEQTQIQRQLRIDAAHPYVWADLRPDDAVGTLINLVVGNSGPTVATNVRVKIDPPLHAIEQLRERVTAAQRFLSTGVRSLSPGRSLTWPLGQGFNLLTGGQAMAYTFTITADGPFGAVPPLTYVIDMSNWEGMVARPSGSLHELTRAVARLPRLPTDEHDGREPITVGPEPGPAAGSISKRRRPSPTPRWARRRRGTGPDRETMGK